MKIGLYNINFGICADPAAIARVAPLAEELGFDSLWAGEHMVAPSPRVPPSPIDPTDPMLDPMATLAFVAAHTSAILLCTGVLLLPQRNPVALAKEAASLDVLAEGRLRLGVGVGYLEPEFRAVGASLEDRGARTVEYLEAMRALWTMDAPAYEGNYVSFSGVDAYPRPASGDIPIVMGGRSRPAFRRAVAMSAGWFGFGLDADMTADCVAGLERAANEVERRADLGDLELTVAVRKLEDDTVERLTSLGVHRIVLLPPGRDLTHLEDWLHRRSPARDRRGVRMVDDRFEHRVVISGIGSSVTGRRLGLSELGLTVDACQRAVADAGLTLSDIDGLVTWPGEYPAPPGFTGPSVWRTKDALSLDLTWHHACDEGPGQSTALVTAMMAVACGYIRHALVYKTTAESTGQAGGRRSGASPFDLGGVTGQFQWLRPFGSVTAATWLAPYFQRYLHEFGATREQVGWLPVTLRASARQRGTAIFPEPLTIEQYLEARMVASPFGLFDCDVPSDGSLAFVISSADYARDAPKPVRVEAVGTRLVQRPLWDQAPDPTALPARDAGAHLWTRTSLTPGDVDTAHLYDGFTYLTLVWLEALGFCGRGEAASFVEGGARIALDGDLPLNTEGGQLSHGRFHGFGHVYEACVQLRGEGGAGQVHGAEVAVVANGGGPLGGVMLLTAP